MIVVDTNVLAYLDLPRSAHHRRNDSWSTSRTGLPRCSGAASCATCSPFIYAGGWPFEQAYAIQTEAEALLTDREYTVDSLEVLRLAEASECSAYDHEFVALAKRPGVPLVSADRKVIRNFPGIAVSLDEAVD